MWILKHPRGMVCIFWLTQLFWLPFFFFFLGVRLYICAYSGNVSIDVRPIGADPTFFFFLFFFFSFP
jgi:hypothetical protein